MSVPFTMTTRSVRARQAREAAAAQAVARASAPTMTTRSASSRQARETAQNEAVRQGALEDTAVRTARARPRASASARRGASSAASRQAVATLEVSRAAYSVRRSSKIASRTTRAAARTEKQADESVTSTESAAPAESAAADANREDRHDTVDEASQVDAESNREADIVTQTENMMFIEDHFPDLENMFLPVHERGSPAPNRRQQAHGPGPALSVGDVELPQMYHDPPLFSEAWTMYDPSDFQTRGDPTASVHEQAFNVHGVLLPPEDHQGGVDDELYTRD